MNDVYVCAVMVLLLQYMVSCHPFLLFVECIWTVLLINRLYVAEVELRETSDAKQHDKDTFIIILHDHIQTYEAKLSTECKSHRETRLQLQRSEAELCKRNEAYNEMQVEFTSLLIDTQLSIDKINVELSDKHNETIKAQQKLSETIEEVKTLKNENESLCKRLECNAGIIDMHKRLRDRTALKLEEVETKLGTAQKVLEDEKAKMKCIICLEDVKDSVMVPCGHTQTCYSCSLKLYERDNAKCPVCRKSIDQILKIYL